MVVLFQRSGLPCFTKRNCDAEQYMSTTYIQFSHTAARSRMCMATAALRSIVTTCRLKFVKVVGRFPNPTRWRGRPLLRSAKRLSASCQTGSKSCSKRTNGFSSGGEKLEDPLCHRNQQTCLESYHWSQLQLRRSGENPYLKKWWWWWCLDCYYWNLHTLVLSKVSYSGSFEETFWWKLVKYVWWALRKMMCWQEKTSLP